MSVICGGCTTVETRAMTTPYMFWPLLSACSKEKVPAGIRLTYTDDQLLIATPGPTPSPPSSTPTSSGQAGFPVRFSPLVTGVQPLVSNQFMFVRVNVGGLFGLLGLSPRRLSTRT